MPGQAAFKVRMAGSCYDGTDHGPEHGCPSCSGPVAGGADPLQDGFVADDGGEVLGESLESLALSFIGSEVPALIRPFGCEASECSNHPPSWPRSVPRLFARGRAECECGSFQYSGADVNSALVAVIEGLYGARNADRGAIRMTDRERNPIGQWCGQPALGVPTVTESPSAGSWPEQTATTPRCSPPPWTCCTTWGRFPAR